MNRPKVSFETLKSHRLLTALVLVGLVLSSVAAAPPPQGPPDMVEVIIVGWNVSDVAGVVRGRGGDVTHRLGVINAVRARLPARAVEALKRHPRIRGIYVDRSIRVADVGNVITTNSSTTIAFVSKSSSTFGTPNSFGAWRIS